MVGFLGSGVSIRWVGRLSSGFFANIIKGVVFAGFGVEACLCKH